MLRPFPQFAFMKKSHNPLARARGIWKMLLDKPRGRPFPARGGDKKFSYRCAQTFRNVLLDRSSRQKSGNHAAKNPALSFVGYGGDDAGHARMNRIGMIRARPRNSSRWRLKLRRLV